LGATPTVFKVLIPLVLWALGVALFLHAPLKGGPMTVPEALYASLGAFVLSAADFPQGTSASALALWGLLFAAPAVTASALADFLRRNLLSDEALVSGLSGHVLICGAGGHGAAIGRVMSGLGYTSVFLDPSVARVPQPDALLLRGDMTAEADLHAAGVRRAVHVFFASGDPLVNLRGASVAAQAIRSGTARLHALVDAPHIVDSVLEQLGLDTTHVTDQYSDAAQAMLADPRIRPILDSAQRVTVVGCGRFGAAVTGALSRCRDLPVWIVDRQAEQKARRLRKHLDADVRVAGTDALDWAGEPADCDVPNHLVLLCVDDDSLGLSCAGEIEKNFADVTVVVRSSRRLGTRGVATRRVIPRSVPELFESALKERFGG
jgi:Trk K+ transport system NAD-binding subunit